MTTADYAVGSFLDGPWAGPGSHGHRLLNPFCEAGVHVGVDGPYGIEPTGQAPTGRASAWLLELLARKPKKPAAVALANKMARIIWAIMVSGETYRRPEEA